MNFGIMCVSVCMCVHIEYENGQSEKKENEFVNCKKRIIVIITCIHIHIIQAIELHFEFISVRIWLVVICSHLFGCSLFK